MPPRWIELLPSPDGSFAPPRPTARPRYGLALLLFALTFVTTTTYGALMVVMSRTDLFLAVSSIDPWTIASVVWHSRDLVGLGLTFSLSALTILLAHELGHYIACRRYGLPCTLPYFLPVPLNFGTFGAFIRIQAPIRTKTELFDVGIAGPIAGFVALIPFLVYGLAHSSYAGPGPGELTELGHPLAIELVARLLHGHPPAGAFLNLHPAALGAWLGLLATAINLLPLGQLDGGHVLYAIFGARQRRLARPLWLALALLGFIWPGWWVWCVLLLVIGIRHPPVADETVPLDRKRKLLGGLALAMLVLSFTSVPVGIARFGAPVPARPPRAPRQRPLPAAGSPAGARAEIEDQGHRPVVDQGHRHPGAEAPRRDA